MEQGRVGIINQAREALLECKLGEIHNQDAKDFLILLDANDVSHL